MELLQLRYFLTVARTLNISHAAKYHMIPQPAMSKTISKLEKELGAALFDRYKNRLSLTEEGKIFQQAVTQAMLELDRGIQECKQEDAPLRGELKLLVRQDREPVADCIMEFKKHYPQVSFQIFYEQDAAEDQAFDLCISCEQPDTACDGQICLITEQLKLVVHKQHPLANAKSVAFQALQQEEFAMISPSSNLCRQTQIHCREAGFEPKISITCGDLHCLIKYIRTGMAVTLGPELAWQSLCSDDVVFVPTQPEVYRSTYVFWNKQKLPSRLANTFRDFLVEYFAAWSSEQIKNKK